MRLYSLQASTIEDIVLKQLLSFGVLALGTATPVVDVIKEFAVMLKYVFNLGFYSCLILLLLIGSV